MPSGARAPTEGRHCGRADRSGALMDRAFAFRPPSALSLGDDPGPEGPALGRKSGKSLFHVGDDEKIDVERRAADPASGHRPRTDQGVGNSRLLQPPEDPFLEAQPSISLAQRDGRRPSCRWRRRCRRASPAGIERTAASSATSSSPSRRAISMRSDGERARSRSPSSLRSLSPTVST